MASRVADALLVNERTIRWRTDAPLHLDVAEFEAARASAKQTTGAERLKAYEDTAVVYRGPLAPDCYEDWIQAERERLAQHYLAVLEQIGLVQEEWREYGQAIDWARQLLTADP